MRESKPKFWLFFSTPVNALAPNEKNLISKTVFGLILILGQISPLAFRFFYFIVFAILTYHNSYFNIYSSYIMTFESLIRKITMFPLTLELIPALSFSLLALKFRKIQILIFLYYKTVIKLLRSNSGCYNSPPLKEFCPQNSYINQKVAGIMSLFFILVSKLPLPYRGVAKAPLPQRLVCSAVVLLHYLE